MNQNNEKESTILRIYMPLTADIVDWNEWDDLEMEAPLDGRDLMAYEEEVLAAMSRERMPEEAERGIMHWYGEEDSVNAKVQSVIFTAEIREGELWGVAECQTTEELSAEEMSCLKKYITGQAADGWGEGLEQREIQTEDGELYIHLWNRHTNFQ